jgi:hypothetical protein
MKTEVVYNTVLLSVWGNNPNRAQTASFEFFKSYTHTQ